MWPHDTPIGLYVRKSEKSWDSEKVDICQNILTWFWALFFQNFNTFDFSWHIFWLMSRAATIILLMQRYMSDGPFRYLERCRKDYRKFSRNIWKKFQLNLEKWSLQWLCTLVTSPVLSLRQQSCSSKRISSGYPANFCLCKYEG